MKWLVGMALMVIGVVTGFRFVRFFLEGQGWENSAGAVLMALLSLAYVAVGVGLMRAAARDKR